MADMVAATVAATADTTEDTTVITLRMTAATTMLADNQDLPVGGHRTRAQVTQVILTPLQAAARRATARAARAVDNSRGRFCLSVRRCLSSLASCSRERP